MWTFTAKLPVSKCEQVGRATASSFDECRVAAQNQCLVEIIRSIVISDRQWTLLQKSLSHLYQWTVSYSWDHWCSACYKVHCILSSLTFQPRKPTAETIFRDETVQEEFVSQVVSQQIKRRENAPHRFDINTSARFGCFDSSKIMDGGVSTVRPDPFWIFNNSACNTGRNKLSKAGATFHCD